MKVSRHHRFMRRGKGSLTFLFLVLCILACAAAPNESISKSTTIETSIEKKSTIFESTSKGRILSGEDDGHHGDDHGEEDGDHFGTHVAYGKVYKTIVYIMTIWVLGEAAKFAGMPSLVGEIVAGFLLGPPLADYVPFEESMVLIGELGLIALLLEAGIDVDITQLSQTGLLALVMAVIGTLLPMAVGFGMANAAGLSGTSALVVGFAFCPTSLGVASNALAAGGLLNTPVGNLIVSTCVLDDILALILLSILEVIAKDDPELFEFFIPFLSSFGFLGVLGYSGITWMPRLIENKILPKFPEEQRENAAFVMMLALMMGYMPVLYYTKASQLTGAFLAGLTFSQIHCIHTTFIQKTHSIMAWMLRIFFASTIGFQVPLKEFDDKTIIGWGFAFYLIIMVKTLLGFFVPYYDKNIPEGYPFNPHVRDAITVGMAMACRGEFSFIIASRALTEGMIDKKMYASIVWAVLLSCITCPFVLMFSVKRYNKMSEEYLSGSLLLNPEKVFQDGKSPLYLVIQTRSGLKWGLQNLMKTALNDLGLVIIDYRYWNPRQINAMIATEVYVQDTKTKVSIQKMLNANASVIKLDSDNIDITGENPEEIAMFKRCNEVREALLAVFDGDDARVQVFEWIPSMLETAEDHCNNLTAEEQQKISEEAKNRLKDHSSGDYAYNEVGMFESDKKTKTPEPSSPLSDVPEGGDEDEEREEDEEKEKDEEQQPPMEEATPTPPPLSPIKVSQPRAEGFQKQLTRRGLWVDDDVVQENATHAEPVGVHARKARRQSRFIPGGLPSIEDNLEGLVRTKSIRFKSE